MKGKFGLTKKIAIGAAAFFIMNFAGAQTVDQGINSIDSYKFAQAKQIYSTLAEQSPSDANYFYLGNTYLAQSEPNFEKAQEYFNKGLATNPKKAYLSRIGNASVQMGRGNVNGAVSEFNAVAKATREKDPEVLYRIGEALIMYDNHNNPKLAIEYLKKAVDLTQRKGVPAHYYYTLGDAYRRDKDWGNAMTAYDNASEVAGNKAPAYTRRGTLWTSAKQWQQAKENIDKAIAADPSYAPAYKALGNYYIIYQQYPEAAANYKKYLDLADTDPDTVLDYAKLAYLAKDFNNAKASLNSVFDKVEDPIKYRILALIQYQEKNYDEAEKNLNTFLSKAEKSRVLPSDSGLMGLINLAKAKANKNSALQQQAMQQIAVAKNAKDETLNWDEEVAAITGGLAGGNSSSVNSGPTNPAIEALKKQVAADPKNSDLIYKLANAYQEAQNWGGAAQAWQQIAALLPTWEPAYYSLGYAYQKQGDVAGAMAAFQKYVDVLTAKPAAEQQKSMETLSNVYYNMAALSANTDRAKALEYAEKAVETNPSSTDAVKLRDSLNK